jgi:putative pyruvate formate lyase activating enzyme
MLSLQARGYHNINLFSLTHVVSFILKTLPLPVNKGLFLSLVYNTSGYDSVKTLNLLDGIVDIYMLDMKYADEKTAERLSGIKNYPRMNQAAVNEMYRQVGDLQLDGQKVAQRGLLVCHLVLPERPAGTREVVWFLAWEVLTDTYLNIMAQYHPYCQTYEISSLARMVNESELSEVIALARQQGLS